MLHAASEKDKDLGIPSKFPFKDEILAEAAELKARVRISCLSPGRGRH